VGRHGPAAGPSGFMHTAPRCQARQCCRQRYDRDRRTRDREDHYNYDRGDRVGWFRRSSPAAPRHHRARWPGGTGRLSRSSRGTVAAPQHPSAPAPQHAEVDAVLGADTCSDRPAYPRTRWRLFAAKQGRVIADAAASVTTSVTASAVGDEGSGPATRNRESQQAFTSRRSVGPGRPTAS
jgi:hypothetical protein